MPLRLRTLLFSLILVFGFSSASAQSDDPAHYINTVMGSEGVVMLDPGDYTARWQIQHEDGRSFVVMDYLNEVFIIDGDTLNIYEAEYHSLPAQKGFKPRRFFVEYGILHFEVAGETDTHFELYINQEKTVTKRIEKASEGVRFEPWVEHLMGVSVLLENNQVIKATPDASAAASTVASCDFYQIEEIVGPWARVSCEGACSFSERVGEEVGWIRWHEGPKIRVELAYAC